jgi:hypothetical protein
VILEESRTKPHQIWSYYEGEIPVGNLKFGLKEKWDFLCVLHLKSVMWHNLGPNDCSESKYEKMLEQDTNDILAQW